MAVVDVLDEPGFQPAAAPAAAELAELIAQFRENRRLFLAHDRGRLARGVKRLEHHAGAIDFPIELATTDEATLIFLEIGEAPLVPEPPLHAFLGDDVGEGLVEDSIAMAEVFPVAELMENGLGEVDVRVVDEGVEHGIVEPAEGGVGIHATDVNIVAVGAKLGGEGDGVRLAEVAAVVHFADGGVEPGLGFQGKLRGGVEHPDDMLAAEIGIFCVTFIAGK